MQAASEMGVKSVLQVDDNWMRSELSATRIARLWPYHEKAIRSCRRQIELADGGFTVSSILRDQISVWNKKAKQFSVIQNGYEDDRYIKGYRRNNRPNSYQGLDLDRICWQMKKKYWKSKSVVC